MFSSPVLRAFLDCRVSAQHERRIATMFGLAHAVCALLRPRDHVAGRSRASTCGVPAMTGDCPLRLWLGRARSSRLFTRGEVRRLQRADVASVTDEQRDQVSGVYGNSACCVSVRRPMTSASVGRFGVAHELRVVERRWRVGRCEHGVVVRVLVHLVCSRSLAKGQQCWWVSAQRLRWL